ncbi:MAG: diguanylate cyclase, partial [Gallionella sp.]
VRAGGQTLPGVTVSLGLAMFPEHGNDRETLLQAADLALYEAKHSGRDRMAVSGEGA